MDMVNGTCNNFALIVYFKYSHMILNTFPSVRLFVPGRAKPPHTYLISLAQAVDGCPNKRGRPCAALRVSKGS